MVKRQRISSVCVLLCSFCFVHRHSHRHYRYVNWCCCCCRRSRRHHRHFHRFQRGCDHEFDRKVFSFPGQSMRKRTTHQHTRDQIAKHCRPNEALVPIFFSHAHFRI